MAISHIGLYSLAVIQVQLEKLHQPKLPALCLVSEFRTDTSSGTKTKQGKQKTQTVSTSI